MRIIKRNTFFYLTRLRNIFLTSSRDNHEIERTNQPTIIKTWIWILQQLSGRSFYIRDTLKTIQRFDGQSFHDLTRYYQEKCNLFLILWINYRTFSSTAKSLIYQNYVSKIMGENALKSYDFCWHSSCDL